MRKIFTLAVLTLFTGAEVHGGVFQSNIFSASSANLATSYTLAGANNLTGTRLTLTLQIRSASGSSTTSGNVYV